MAIDDSARRRVPGAANPRDRAAGRRGRRLGLCGRPGGARPARGRPDRLAVHARSGTAGRRASRPSRAADREPARAVPFRQPGMDGRGVRGVRGRPRRAAQCAPARRRARRAVRRDGHRARARRLRRFGPRARRDRHRPVPRIARADRSRSRVGGRPARDHRRVRPGLPARARRPGVPACRSGGRDAPPRADGPVARGVPVVGRFAHAAAHGRPARAERRGVGQIRELRRQARARVHARFSGAQDDGADPPRDRQCPLTEVPDPHRGTIPGPGRRPGARGEGGRAARARVVRQRPANR